MSLFKLLTKNKKSLKSWTINLNQSMVPHGDVGKTEEAQVVEPCGRAMW